MTKIIAAIDNSVTARAVLAMATVLAPVLEAEVEAMYVGEDEGTTASGEAESVGVPFHQHGGDVCAELCERACRGDVVGVVMGSRSRRSARGSGHLVREVANVITKPVVVVPPDAQAPEHLHTVVVAMEGTALKARRLRAATQMVAGSDLELVVVHVDDDETIPSFSDQFAHETAAYADAFLARSLRGEFKAHLELRIGVPADEILAVADSVAADMVVVGWPQSNDEHRGVVAREILGRTHCPIMLIAVESTEPADA